MPCSVEDGQYHAYTQRKTNKKPVSLTPALPKTVVEFMVANYISPAVLKVIDRDQYGGIPKSCDQLPFAMIDVILVTLYPLYFQRFIKTLDF